VKIFDEKSAIKNPMRDSPFERFPLQTHAVHNFPQRLTACFMHLADYVSLAGKKAGTFRRAGKRWFAKEEDGINEHSDWTFVSAERSLKQECRAAFPSFIPRFNAILRDQRLLSRA